MISKKHLHRNETVCAIFEGGPKKGGARGNCLIHFTQYPPLVLINRAFYFAITFSSHKFTYVHDILVHIFGWAQKQTDFNVSDIIF